MWCKQRKYFNLIKISHNKILLLVFEAKILGNQITTKNSRIELLTKRTTRDKILEYFKMQSQKKGSKVFTIPLTFTELANYLSVDRSAMTREIKNLKDDGFIKTNGRKITLLY